MRLDRFRASILHSDQTLAPFGVKVSDLLLNPEEGVFDDIVYAFVSLTAIQVRSPVPTPGPWAEELGDAPPPPALGAPGAGGHTPTPGAPGGGSGGHAPREPWVEELGDTHPRALGRGAGGRPPGGHPPWAGVTQPRLPPDRSHRSADRCGAAARRHHRALAGGGGLRLRRRLPVPGGGRAGRLLEGPVHQGRPPPIGCHGCRGYGSPAAPVVLGRSGPLCQQVCCPIHWLLSQAPSAHTRIHVAHPCGALGLASAP